MKKIFLTIIVALIYSWHVPSSLSAPQISCQIGTAEWCIAHGADRVQVKDAGIQRIWSLEDEVMLESGPLTILESRKNCANGAKVSVKKLYERLMGQEVAIAYSLTAEADCFLEFKMPQRDGIPNSAYERFMRFGILIEGKQLADF